MTSRVHLGRVAGFVLLAGCAVAACQTALTDVSELVGPRAFDFSVGPSALVLPSGAANREIVRTLVVRHQLSYDTLGLLVDSIKPLPSTNTEDTTAVDSAAVVMVRGLRALAGGRVYQAWAQAPDGSISAVYGNVVEYSHYYTGQNNPITGDSIFAPDSAGHGVGGQGSYTGSDDPTVDSVAFRLVPSDGANTVNPFDVAAVNALFVSVEAGPATAPSAAQFLWRRVGIATGGTANNATVTVDTVFVSTNPLGSSDPTPDTIDVVRRARSTLVGTGTLTFGNYGGLDASAVNSTADYVFSPKGAGLGGARGPELSVDFREMLRPPVGFYYVGYVVDHFGNGVLVDTLRSAWNKDDPTISRVSLFDADVDETLPGVEGTDIRYAQVRNCASGSAQNNCQNSMNLPATDTFQGMEAFQLKLEPKNGVAAGPKKSVVLAGPIPVEVK
jgi:hypothetical protein